MSNPFAEPPGQAVIAWQAWLGAQTYTFVALHLPGFGWYLTGQLTHPIGWDALCHYLPPVDGRFLVLGVAGQITQNGAS